ncbi:MAG: S-methyl-5-thioribose-1-phosphate isomerase [Deinococcus sp.]
MKAPPVTLAYRDGKVTLLDQTRLPQEEVYLDIGTPEAMWEAIEVLRVRGAPAIGAAAAYGLWLGVRDAPEAEGREDFLGRLEGVAAYLGSSRPTAVNLFWALERGVQAARRSAATTPAALKEVVLEEAEAIRREEAATCRAIGEHGLTLLGGVSSVLTHCNAGSLATTGIGTALAPIYVAAEQGQTIHVYADETRPLLQGARLTAWELQQAGLPVTLITDNMSASVMRAGRVGAVIVGCDRVAANGDFANKIGTYGVAILAREHDIPFYVAAPFSTIDFAAQGGDAIEIELRDPSEVTSFGQQRSAPEGVDVFNPAFDVTPARLVTAFITERGVVRPPFAENLARLRDEGEAVAPPAGTPSSRL